MIPNPENRTMAGRWRNNLPPRSAEATPRVLKTKVKPTLNASAARRATVRAWARPSSETGSAEIYDR